MRILPVLDVRAGLVVRGIAGRRAHYRPLLSSLAGSADPLEIAEAFRHHLGLDGLYVADLSAIAGRRTDLPLLAGLHARGFHLLVDAGIRGPADAGPLIAAGVDTVVLGLETLDGPEVIAALVQRWGPERFVFSLDLRAGQPMGRGAAWADTPLAIAAQAVDTGCQRIIVLDLAQVGTGTGPATEPMLHQLRQAHSLLELIAGGGVRGRDDLLRLRSAGASAVLVASALHDGQLTAADIAGL